METKGSAIGLVLKFAIAAIALYFMLPYLRARPAEEPATEVKVVEEAKEDLFHTASFTEVSGENGMQGMRISSIRPESLWAQWGFKNTDIITSLNGRAMSSQYSFESELKNINQKQSISSAEVLRAGRPLSLRLSN